MVQVKFDGDRQDPWPLGSAAVGCRNNRFIDGMAIEWSHFRRFTEICFNEMSVIACIHFAPLRDRIRTGTVAAFFGRPIQVSSWTETWICDCKLECHFRDLFVCFISDQCEESAEGWIIDDHLFLRVKVFFLSSNEWNTGRSTCDALYVSLSSTTHATLIHWYWNDGR